MTPLTLTTITTILNKATSELILNEKDYYDGLFSRGFSLSNYRVTMDIFKVNSFTFADEIYLLLDKFVDEIYREFCFATVQFSSVIYERPLIETSNLFKNV